MATFKSLYGDPKTVSITLDNLASSTTLGRQSTVIDNTTDLYIDVLAQAKVQIGTGGTVSGDKTVYVYVFGATNDVFPAERGVAATQSNIGHTDAAYSITDDSVGGSPLVLARMIPVPVAPTGSVATYVTSPFSVGSCFGGLLPPAWGACIVNQSGITLNSTGNAIYYRGIASQSA